MVRDIGIEKNENAERTKDTANPGKPILQNIDTENPLKY